MRTRDIGKMSHITFIACRISGIDLHVLLGMCVLLCEHGIAGALRWGVTLVRVYSIGLCSPHRGTPFFRMCRQLTLIWDLKHEGNRWWLLLYFVFYFEHTNDMYIFLYKRVVIKLV